MSDNLELVRTHTVDVQVPDVPDILDTTEGATISIAELSFSERDELGALWTSKLHDRAEELRRDNE